MASQVIKNTPSAAVGATGGTLAVLVTWVGGNVFHYSISAEDGALLATVIGAAALFLGRHGIRGVASIVWRGNGSDKADAPASVQPNG